MLPVQEEEPKDAAGVAVVNDMLALSHAQLLAQIADETSLDGRTMGLLAFNGALLAAEVAAQNLLGPYWWTLLPALGASAGLCVWSVFGGSGDFGPRPLEFYETYGGLDPPDAGLQLLADLDGAFNKNGARVTWKGRRLRSALVALAIGLVVAAILIALNKPTTLGKDAQKPTVSVSRQSAATSSGASPGSGPLRRDPRRTWRHHP